MTWDFCQWWEKWNNFTERGTRNHQNQTANGSSAWVQTETIFPEGSRPKNVTPSSPTTVGVFAGVINVPENEGENFQQKSFLLRFSAARSAWPAAPLLWDITHSASFQSVIAGCWFWPHREACKAACPDRLGSVVMDTMSFPIWGVMCWESRSPQLSPLQPLVRLKFSPPKGWKHN